MSRNSSHRPPADCAQCGESIPPQAHACPGCGADERTGWREASVYDGLDLPDYADADDDTSAQRPLVPPRVNGLAWYWWVLALMLLFALGLSALGLLA
jgi:hypothetical protein